MLPSGRVCMAISFQGATTSRGERRPDASQLRRQRRGAGRGEPNKRNRLLLRPLRLSASAVAFSVFCRRSFKRLVLFTSRHSFDEHAPQVAVEDVLRHVLRDDGPEAISRRVEVTALQRAATLKPDVQQLAEARCTSKRDGRAHAFGIARSTSGRPPAASVEARSMSMTVAYGAHSSSNRPIACAYTSRAISSPSPPAEARPISSSSHVVPAVLRCRPCRCGDRGMRIAG